MKLPRLSDLKPNRLAVAVVACLIDSINRTRTLRANMDAACAETSAELRRERAVTGAHTADTIRAAMTKHAPPKRKRVRVRTKPLTLDDIVEGGVYVPKRGNDKTPNWVVEAVIPSQWCVSARRTVDAPGNVRQYDVEEFLSMVARRVEVAS